MKKFLLLFAAILMASAGLWAETVNYLYPVYNTDGVPTSGIKEWKTASVDATVVEDDDTPVTWGTAGETTWYVVTGTDVTLSKGAVCQGDVHLILADGAKLTTTGITNYAQNIHTAGIRVSGENNTLTIYGQTEQTGQLIAIGGYESAGIGGNTEEDGSNITINGGTVTANSESEAAGIGGGYTGNGTNITINGGTVTANGGIYAAGIGGGRNVGMKGNGTNITINDGTVTANGGIYAAGIGGGGGAGGSGSNITINGGTVTAKSEDGTAGIGGGTNGSGSNIYVATSLIIKADNNNPPLSIITNTGSDLASSLAGKRFVTIDSDIADADLVNYIDENGEEKSVYAYEVTSSENVVTLGAVNGAVWYIVNDPNVVLSQGAVCQGDVRLILADGAKLTATGITDVPNNIYTPGIQVSDGNTFTIYGQTAQSGQLEANGGKLAAGIGGGHSGSGSNITINGGMVTANGGGSGAGIGGGNNGSGSNITINSGMVTANGGGSGAGIGGGERGSGSNITINGGTVTANGGGSSAGIGGGNKGSGSKITINDGVVTAIGNGGAGIGGGASGDGSYITINGGTVTATSDSSGSGIGGGALAYGSNITINGGRVTATGGYLASGIGCGYKSGGLIALGSMIFVSTNLIVTADVINPPIIIIAAYRTATTDIANDLVGKQYVVIELNPLPDAKAAAIAAINEAISETAPDDIKVIATNAVAAINAATEVEEVNAIKTFALSAIVSAKAMLGTLSEKQNGPALIVTDKDDNEIILYSPKSVEYIKVKEE